MRMVRGLRRFERIGVNPTVVSPKQSEPVRFRRALWGKGEAVLKEVPFREGFSGTAFEVFLEVVRFRLRGKRKIRCQVPRTIRCGGYVLPGGVVQPPTKLHVGGMAARLGPPL